MNKQVIALASDEETEVMWDIDALLSDHSDRASVEVDTRRLTPESWLTIDSDYAMKTDLDTPIILFELPGHLLFIADGNHRLYRAVKEGVPTMKVIVIPQEIHLSYLFRSSVADYYRVIASLKNENIFIEDFFQR